MMRWLPEEAGDRFQNAVSSLNKQTQAIYGCDLVLADYRGKEGTLNSLQEIWDALTDTEKAVRELSTFQLNPTMPDSKEYGAIEQSPNSIFDSQFFPRPQGEKKLG